MSIYYDAERQAFRWQFKATIDGTRHRLSRLLPRRWSEAQARRYDETETARTYARLATGRRIDVPLIDAAVSVYLKERVPQLEDSKHTAENLAHLLRFFRGRGLDELGKVARLYAEKHADKLAPATIRQRLATLKAAANYALKYHDLGSSDWIAAMPMPTVKNERHYYLTREQLVKLVRSCSDFPTRALIILTFATGSRPGELFRADACGDHFLMPETKNGTRSTKPVLQRFQQYMRHWPMPHGYEWHSARFREARSACGFDWIHLHDVRHAAASAMASAGVGLSEIGHVLDHKTAQATKRYAHFYPEAKAAALAKIWQKRPHKKAS